MGYRHQVISDTMVPLFDELPGWFKEKYSGIIELNREFWASYSEYKRYMLLAHLNDDIQIVMRELGVHEDKAIRLVYFADEGSRHLPDVIHTTITKESIVEIKPTEWEPLD